MNPMLINGSSSDLSIYETTSLTDTSLFTLPVGTAGYDKQDGRVWHYCHNNSGSNLAIGTLCTAPPMEANHINLDCGTVPAGQNILNDVTLGATAAAENLYRDGYAYVNDGTGQGQIFRIRSHAAIASAGTGDFILYDNITTALVASGTSQVSLHRNPWQSPVVASATTGLVANAIVGVPNVTIADGDGGWLQTWGPCCVLHGDGAAEEGKPVVADTTQDGAIDDATTFDPDELFIGQMMEPGVSAESNLVFLRISAA